MLLGRMDFCQLACFLESLEMYKHIPNIQSIGLLLSKAVSWAQQTNGMSSGEWVLTKSHALLIFGVDEFAMDLEEVVFYI